jgi:hypothetical protein
MAWDVIFYATAEGSVPGADFLDGCPAKVRGMILAVLDAVAAAPPPAFSGGGKWEAMHGDMGGYHEIRVTGPGREQFRLFCLLENADRHALAARGLRGPGYRRDHRDAQENRDGLQRPRLRQGPPARQRLHSSKASPHSGLTAASK